MLLCNHTGRTCTTFLHVQISRDSLRLEDVNIWSHTQDNYSEHPRGRTAYDSSSPAHIDEQNHIGHICILPPHALSAYVHSILDLCLKPIELHLRFKMT